MIFDKETIDNYFKVIVLIIHNSFIQVFFLLVILGMMLFKIVYSLTNFLMFSKSIINIHKDQKE